MEDFKLVVIEKYHFENLDKFFDSNFNNSGLPGKRSKEKPSTICAQGQAHSKRFSEKKKAYHHILFATLMNHESEKSVSFKKSSRYVEFIFFRRKPVFFLTAT